MKSDNNYIELIKKNTDILHPITSTLIKSNNSNILLTKYLYDKEFYFITSNTNNSEEINSNIYNEYLHIPPVGISSSVLLELYNIKLIDDLYKYIKKNIKLINILTLIRILNAWIYNNIIYLKYNLKLLRKIILLLFKKFNSNLYQSNKNIKNDFNIFIKKWLINNKNNNIFNINIIYDFNEYLTIK